MLAQASSPPPHPSSPLPSNNPPPPPPRPHAHTHTLTHTPPPPPGRTAQLYREKMEGVDAWLHSASVPRHLKHKIRAFYAGGLGGRRRPLAVRRHPFSSLATACAAPGQLCAAHRSAAPCARHPWAPRRRQRHGLPCVGPHFSNNPWPTLLRLVRSPTPSTFPAPAPADVWLRHAAARANVQQQFLELPHALRQEVAWELNKALLTRLPLFR